MTGGPFIHPDQSPQEKTRNAQEMAARRWQGSTPEERSAALRAVAGHRIYGPAPGKPRCACGAMTLARAEARADSRGTGLGHRPGCPFYRGRALPRGGRRGKGSRRPRQRDSN